MDNVDELIAALVLARKYLKPDDYPTHCEHDTLHIMVDPKKVSEEDLEQFETFSFSPDFEFGETLVSTKFGSS